MTTAGLVVALLALPPAEYERLRAAAPLTFAAVVLDDPGGAASVRVEAVDRGSLAVGATVTVRYPEHYGQEIPAGGDIWYRRFGPGDRLRVFGRMSSPDVVTIVPAGLIEARIGPPPPPRLDRRLRLVREPWWIGLGGGTLVVAGALAFLHRRRRRRLPTP